MKLTIYMRSGNVIKLRNIVDYKIENKGNEIVSLELDQQITFLGIFPRSRLLVKTVALNQIEAIVRK